MFSSMLLSKKVFAAFGCLSKTCFGFQDVAPAECLKYDLGMTPSVSFGMEPGSCHKVFSSMLMGCGGSEMYS